MHRPEHNNPQFARSEFKCLNGTWQIAIPGKGVMDIEVPFCPESKASGVAYTDFIPECRYMKTLSLEKPSENERLFLNFGAVDYEAHVYVNGELVGKHRGGYVPFAFDIAPFVKDGENKIQVNVFDDTKGNQPTGKQSDILESHGCFYTRTTGIWQSVWLEKTPKDYIRSVKFFPDIHAVSVDAQVCVEGDGEVEVIVSYEGKEVGRAKRDVKYKNTLHIPLSEKHLWEVGNGRLYDVTIKYGDDVVNSYFGLREVRYDGMKFMLNDECVYQRLVLDQGFYPDGIYTATSDDALVKDIKIGFKLGFNGARLHQKVFEPRFLYHADKLGYMVWGEYPSWGVNYEDLEALGDVTGEWVASMERDFNHPCIVTWCPLNETWENLKDKRKVRDVRFIDSIYATTKAVDPTRPVVDVSGGYHGHATDLFDLHCYHDPDRLRAHLQALDERDEITTDLTFAPDWYEENIPYTPGQPINYSEYGGVSYATDGKGWGYRASSSEEEFVEGYIALTKQLIDCKKVSGFCYTQLYDIEQEQNGLYNYDRSPKFSEKAMKKIAECNQAIAEIEKQD